MYIYIYYMNIKKLLRHSDKSFQVHNTNLLCLFADAYQNLEIY